jgi:hypothetical protein
MSEFQRSSFCAAGACVEVAFEKSSFCADRTCVEVAAGPQAVLMRDALGTMLNLEPAQWSEFLAGVAAGEFN